MPASFTMPTHTMVPPWAVVTAHPRNRGCVHTALFPGWRLWHVTCVADRLVDVGGDGSDGSSLTAGRLARASNPCNQLCGSVVVGIVGVFHVEVVEPGSLADGRLVSPLALIAAQLRQVQCPWTLSDRHADCHLGCNDVVARRCSWARTGLAWIQLDQLRFLRALYDEHAELGVTT